MTQNAESQSIRALVTKLENPGRTSKEPIADWLVQVMMAGAKSPGFWSGEIIPPKHPSHHEWHLVQRFSSAEHTKVWHASERRTKLIEEFAAATNAQGLVVSDELADHLGSGDVATAITTEVKVGMEDVYFIWEAKIQKAQAKFPGYNGSYLQPPAPGKDGQWSTLLRFDKPESLQNWFDSDERKSLLNEASDFITATYFESLSSSFPGWFPIDKETGKGPANWKTSMLVLLGLFPVVMLELRFVSPFLSSLQPDLSTFISLVFSVIITTWVTIPLFIKAFKWWLFPKKGKRTEDNLKGTLVMVALFTAEIAALWNLIPLHR